MKANNPIHNIQTSKYLQNYAEPEADNIASALNFSLNPLPLQSIVVPAFDEEHTFFHRLYKPLAQSHPTLWILVTNGPEHAPPEAKARTKALFDNSESYACDTIQLHAMQSSTNFKLYRLTSACHSNKNATNAHHLLLIDRITHPIPSKQGVGLARKIGFDLACQLMVDKKLPVQWIATTDADVNLPVDYLEPLNQHYPTRPSALIFPFQHRLPPTPTFSAQETTTENDHNVDQAILTATQEYEAHLNYYVDGLRFAGSPYAFHTLGSTLAIDPIAYCQVRGFPKRSAGEDFYMLNKLRKVAPILSLQQPTLHIAARRSQRAPFGTGPAIEKSLAFDKDQQPSVLGRASYHPLSFHWLKDLLNAVDHYADHAADERIALLTHYVEKQPWHAVFVRLCNQADLNVALAHLNEHKTGALFRKQWHHWFDAFKTMRFIHLIRDEMLGSVPLEAARLPAIHHSTIQTTQTTQQVHPDKTPTHAL